MTQQYCSDVESGILDTTAESFDRHVAVNARVTLLLIAAFARQVDKVVSDAAQRSLLLRRVPHAVERSARAGSAVTLTEQCLIREVL